MDGIAWAASAMIAARTRLEIATDNLANVSSDGFHAVLARGLLTSHGVEIARVNGSGHGAFTHTGRPYDFAIIGDGAFRIQASNGSITATRAGSFERDRTGVLRDARGRALLGLHGPLRIPDGATIDEHGRVFAGARQIDRIPTGTDAAIRSGFVETSNVDAIGEMVGVLTSQRSFESAEKVVAAIDGVRQKNASDVARIK
jgi:flagellar basal-body rod protein FlgF